MTRYRLEPTPKQESVLLGHCGHARFVWNLCVEQEAEWRPGRGRMPRFAERCRQLTEARADNPWLAEGSVIVQQQAIRDHAQTMEQFFAGTHRLPSWRKAGRHQGFRIVAVGQGDVRRLNRNWAEVKIPKAGWVRFRWSRPVPQGVKSYRVTLDRAGRWHIAFAHVPQPVSGPGTGAIVGVDRGIVISAALSTGELLRCQGLSPCESKRFRTLQRKLARAKRGSGRRFRTRSLAARLKAREVARRKDWCEKVSTDLAQRFDVIRVEDLRIPNLTRSARGTVDAPGRNVAQKAGLNRGIHRSAWGLLVRKSQALYLCIACGYACNADANAARNIAAGHAVKARGGHGTSQPMNREPQHTLLAS